MVESVSGVASVDGDLTQLSITVFDPNSGGRVLTGFVMPPTQNAVGHAFNERVLFYIDPGNQVWVYIGLAGGATFMTGSGAGETSVTLTGIAVDCSIPSGGAARPYCAPIVH